MRVNMIGSANVLEAAAHLRRAQARRSASRPARCSASYAFRSEETDARRASAPVGEARWTYAVSKLAEEHLAIAYHREQRPAGHGGAAVQRLRARPGRRRRAAQLHRSARSQTRPDRDPRRRHADPRLVLRRRHGRGVLLAARAPAAVGESFNIGNQRAVITIYGLANTVVRVLESASEIRFVPHGLRRHRAAHPAVDKARDAARLRGARSISTKASAAPRRTSAASTVPPRHCRSRPVVVDANAHVTRDGRWFDTGHDASLSRLLAELDAASIDRAVLTGLPGADLDRRRAGAVRRGRRPAAAGRRVRSVRASQPGRGVCAARRELSGRGLLGVKLHPRLGRYDVLDDRVLAFLDDLGTWDERPAVWICTFLNVPGMRPRSGPVEALSEIVGRRPDLQFVLAHGGGPDLLRAGHRGAQPAQRAVRCLVHDQPLPRQLGAARPRAPAA